MNDIDSKLSHMPYYNRAARAARGTGKTDMQFIQMWRDLNAIAGIDCQAVSLQTLQTNGTDELDLQMHKINS